MKLRSHLILLVLAAIVPLMILGGALIFIFHQQEVAVQEQSLVDRSHALSLEVDREIAGTIRALGALASSEYLDSGDLRRFHERAIRAVKAYGGAEAIVLADERGRQVASTRFPFGTALPGMRASETFEQVWRTGRPVISNLFFAPVVQKPLITISVPVMRAGKMKYVVTASASPEFLSTILAQQRLPHGWLATIVDRNKATVARTQNLNEFLGKLAGAVFVAKSGEHAGGVFRGITREGIAVATGYRRSELTGWTVGVAIPLALLEAPLKRSLWMLVLSGLLLLSVSAAAAFLFGRRIAMAYGTLSDLATTMGRGGSPRAVSLPIAEANEVGRVIEDAAVKRHGMEATLRALSAHLEQVREEERARIAREVHDELGQALTVLKMDIASSAPPVHDGTLALKLKSMSELVDEMVQTVRRIASELRPGILDDLGIVAALQWQAQEFSKRGGVRCRFVSAAAELPIDKERSTALFRICQETLTNVARHARATEVEIALSRQDHVIILEVQDNGRGITADDLANTKSLGLIGLRERALLFGGTCEIKGEPEKGTKLTVTIPV